MRDVWCFTATLTFACPGLHQDEFAQWVQPVPVQVVCYLPGLGACLVFTDTAWTPLDSCQPGVAQGSRSTARSCCRRRSTRCAAPCQWRRWGRCRSTAWAARSGAAAHRAWGAMARRGRVRGRKPEIGFGACPQGVQIGAFGWNQLPSMHGGQALDSWQPLVIGGSCSNCFRRAARSPRSNSIVRLSHMSCEALATSLQAGL